MGLDERCVTRGAQPSDGLAVCVAERQGSSLCFCQADSPLSAGTKSVLLAIAVLAPGPGLLHKGYSIHIFQ